MKYKLLMKKIARKYSNLLIFFGMVLIFSLLSPVFFTTDNLINVARQISIVTILAFGETILIISGEIDLSVGAIAAMCGTFSVILFKSTNSLVLALLLGIAMGAIVGALNGLIVTRFKVVSFIATLAMQQICVGIVFSYTKGQNIYSVGNFTLFGQGSVGFIPNPIIIMIFIFIIVTIILQRTSLGRYFYAIGGNQSAAMASGIQIKKVKMIGFILSGTFAGLGGVILMSRLNAGLPAAGGGYELDALMATIIGGTSFSGGVGTAAGTFIGSFIIGILNNFLNLKGIQSYIQQILKGVLIISAVIVDMRSKQARRVERIF